MYVLKSTFDLTNVKINVRKSERELMRIESASKDTDDAALMSYGRQFHIAGAAQRKAHDPIFLRETVRVVCR